MESVCTQGQPSISAFYRLNQTCTGTEDRLEECGHVYYTDECPCVNVTEITCQSAG